MKTGRREFILGAAALGLTPGAFAAEAPRLRFGVLADIQVYKRLKTSADNGYRTWDEFERQFLHKSRKAAWEKCFKELWAPIIHKNVKGYDFVLCNFTAGEPDNKWGNNTPGSEEFLAKLNLPKGRPSTISAASSIRPIARTDSTRARTGRSRSAFSPPIISVPNRRRRRTSPASLRRPSCRPRRSTSKCVPRLSSGRRAGGSKDVCREIRLSC